MIRTRFYRVAGMGESDLDALIAPVYTKYTNPVDDDSGGVRATFRSICAPVADRRKTPSVCSPKSVQPIEALLGDAFILANGDPLETVVGALLRERSATLSVAESCTGGMLGERITSIAGSSDYFVGGFVTYTDRMKTDLLGVDPALIAQHTSVSKEVARAMADGTRARTEFDVCHLDHR